MARARIAAGAFGSPPDSLADGQRAAASTPRLGVRSLPLGLIVGGILAAEMIFTAGAYSNHLAQGRVLMPNPAHISNTKALGQILYTDYVLVFQLAGMVLLVAMLGAIVLTLRHGRDVKRQSAAKQTKRTRDETVELVSVTRGSGIAIGEINRD